MESRQTERTRDSVYNRLEWPAADPNVDDDYTPSSITLLALGEARTYVLGLMLDVHDVSNKLSTDL